jgi:hypothetical protein
MTLWSVVRDVGAAVGGAGLVVYLLYRLVVWARTRAKGAYVLGAALAPFFALGNVSDPDFRIVNEAKQDRKREEDDPGDPPDEG